MHDVSNVAYFPDGLWHRFDFKVHDHYWDKIEHAGALPIRRKNLSDVLDAISAAGITHFVFGKTLKGIIETGALIRDHDDDVGIFLDDVEAFLSDVRPRLESQGFRLIRHTSQIISFERNFRYVDICLFRPVGRNKIGYGSKQCCQKHFERLEVRDWNDRVVPVPAHPQDLLRDLYYKRKGNENKLLQRLIQLRTLNGLKKLHGKVQNVVFRVARKLPASITTLLNPALHLFGVQVVDLTKEDFLQLKIEPDNSFNWGWRKRHLDLITNSGQCSKIGDIVNYLSAPDMLRRLDEQVVETDMSHTFREPLSLDMDFWWAGNNFFYYCVKYQFRKQVVSYLHVNEYVGKQAIPELYTAEYFQSLEEMTEQEIEQFVHEHPIELESDAIGSGKHRACAMIGRLLDGKPYVPMRAVVCDKL